MSLWLSGGCTEVPRMRMCTGRGDADVSMQGRNSVADISLVRRARDRAFLYSLYLSSLLGHAFDELAAERLIHAQVGIDLSLFDMKLAACCESSCL